MNPNTFPQRGRVKEWRSSVSFFPSPPFGGAGGDFILSRRIEVIKWRDFIHMEQYDLNFPDLTHPLDTIKMKWEEGEWNMYERDPDYIVGTDYVKSICKLEENSTQEVLCHIDSANWTLMKENGITKELYELMMYTGSTIRNGFDKEVERFEINWDAVENILSMIGGF